MKRLKANIDGNKVTVNFGAKTGVAKYNRNDKKLGLPFRPEVGLAIAFMRASGVTEDEVDIFTDRLLHASQKANFAEAKGEFVPFKPGDWAEPIFPWGDKVWDLNESYAKELVKRGPVQVKSVFYEYSGKPVRDRKQSLFFTTNACIWPADHFRHASSPEEGEKKMKSEPITSTESAKGKKISALMSIIHGLAAQLEDAKEPEEAIEIVTVLSDLTYKIRNETELSAVPCGAVPDKLEF